MTFGLACCAIEMIASSTARFDIARFGSEVFRPSPRQSDLMIVAGTVTLKMAPVVKRIYDQMPDPKWVISMGACSSVGGPFNTYAVLQGVDKIVPVDVYVTGCPPRPENLFYALLKLQDKIDHHDARQETDRSPAGSQYGGELQAASDDRADAAAEVGSRLWALGFWLSHSTALREEQPSHLHSTTLTEFTTKPVCRHRSNLLRTMSFPVLTRLRNFAVVTRKSASPTWMERILRWTMCACIVADHSAKG